MFDVFFSENYFKPINFDLFSHIMYEFIQI